MQVLGRDNFDQRPNNIIAVAYYQDGVGIRQTYYGADEVKQHDVFLTYEQVAQVARKANGVARRAARLERRDNEVMEK